MGSSKTGDIRITLYGIPNCDQVKQARTWLTQQGVDAHFHDFKKAGITPAVIAQWLAHLPHDALLNRRGTTWRALSDSDKAAVIDNASAIACMVANPSVIKRPVLVLQGAADQSVMIVQAGFSGPMYHDVLRRHGLLDH